MALFMCCDTRAYTRLRMHMSVSSFRTVALPVQWIYEASCGSRRKKRIQSEDWDVCLQLQDRIIYFSFFFF